MGDWQTPGRRIKAEWLGMLRGMAGSGGGPVKLPFVPLTLDGRSLRMVLGELLPVILGENPSLLTLIREGGEPVKAYAEDASSGVYEKLDQLEVPAGSTRESLLSAAKGAGVEVGITKEADVAFFEPFGAEPDDLLEALALLASAGAAALRDGRMSFHPPVWAADLAKGFALDVETTREVLSRLLAPGTYGIGLECASGCVGLKLDVCDGAWTISEEQLPEAVRSGEATLGVLCRTLIDQFGCGLAVAVRLGDLRALGDGTLPVDALIAARGESWEIVTRSGLEGLVRLVPSAIAVLELEKDFEECNFTFESIMRLVKGYVASGIAYARDKGIRVKIEDGERVFRLVLDGDGVRAAPDEEGFDDEALSLPLGWVRSAISIVSSDPLQAVRDLVPREMIDDAKYSTAVCVVECDRPRGRLLLFGGPHEFFDHSWTGDACGVFLDARGGATVIEQPGRPLEVSPDGRTVRFDSDELSVSLTFDRTESESSRHGLSRFFGDEKVADWLPGLQVDRIALRLVSGEGELNGSPLSCGSGRMFLENGRGRLLRWPFGATWHYASWLMADGACGAMVRAAPMMGTSTPDWWRRIVASATDGASGVPDRAADYAIALEPGSPARVIADAARIGETELQYRILSAVVVPFDEDGQVIFRLRCLCGDGAGLVEIPASLPGVELRAARCDVEFSGRGASLRAGGRELLSVQTNESAFLSPYVPPRGGVFSRLARWLSGPPAR